MLESILWAPEAPGAILKALLLGVTIGCLRYSVLIIDLVSIVIRYGITSPAPTPEMLSERFTVYVMGEDDGLI